MVACILGTIVDIQPRLVIIEDRLTKKNYNCTPETDEFLDYKIGDSGVFVGQIYNEVFRIRKVEIRTFLNPLYESDLYDASGKYNLISPIDNPFTEVFQKYLEAKDESTGE